MKSSIDIETITDNKKSIRCICNCIFGGKKCS